MKNSILTLISIMVMIFFLSSCSTTDENKSVSSIVGPGEDVIIDCSWITINGEYGYGVNMTVTPTGIEVYRKAGIYYNKSELIIEVVMISGGSDFVSLLDSDIIDYEVYVEDE